MAGFGEHVISDGASITRPPAFNSQRFSFWKIKFQNFILATDLDLWDVFEIGNFVPQKKVDDVLVPKTRIEFDEHDMKKALLNRKAVLMLQAALNEDDFFRICTLPSAKHMWEALEIAYEGTEAVKEGRVNTLTTEYDLLRMKEGETIGEFEMRHTHLINKLAALGKTYDQRTQVRKILNILTDKWEAKVTAIEESRGESMMSVAALFGSLAEYESKQKFKKELSGIEDRKKKGLALKTIKEKEPETEPEEEEEVEDEELAMVVRRFKKLYRRDQPPRKFQKGASSKEIICYECNKPGHMRADCPLLPQRNKDKKRFKSFKKKKAYVSGIWGDSSSEDESEPEEEANICLVAQEETNSETDEVIIAEPTYDELRLEYDEMHVELLKFAKELASLRKKVKEFEKPVTKEVTIECSKCTNLRKDNERLNKALEKFTKGSEMLQVILKSQKVVNDRTGIGYNPISDKRKGKKRYGGKSYLKYFQKSIHTSDPFASCTYCNRKGHRTSSCYFKKGKMLSTYKWVPKGTHEYKSCQTNLKGPNKLWVPKTMT